MKKTPQNLWCVGRNYVEHAKELQNEVPTSPLIFLKSGACVNMNRKIELPAWAEDLHHEIELVLQVDENLEFSSLALGLDLTERTLQTQLKAKGQPWTLAKSFLNAAPLSPLLDLQSIRSAPLQSWWKELEISLSVNSEIKQKSSCAMMIFDPFTLLSFIKKHFPLQPYDLIFTGTPAGVGPLRPGNTTLAEMKLGKESVLSWQAEF